MTAILGLDLSLTATGFAILDNDGHHTGCIHPAGATIQDRLTSIADTLQRLIVEHPIVDVTIEDLPRNPRYGGTALGMVHAAYWLATRHFTLNTTAVTPASLKVLATGTGNAGKDEVLASAIRRLGYQGHDHNQADALWLADLGARLQGWPRPDLPASHLRALTKITKAAA